jgi:hypothetical protein
MSKFSEVPKFLDVLNKIQESLEVSFEDPAIEKSNDEIVTRLLESEKMQTLIKAMLFVREAAKVSLLSCQMHNYFLDLADPCQKL